MRRIHGIGAAVALAVSLFGCRSSTEPDNRTNPIELALQRQRWAAAGIEDYRMRVRLQGAWFGGAAVIEVRDGAPVSITPIQQGESFPEPQPFHAYDTAEEMFEVVERALEQGADRLHAQYHGTLGIPVNVYVDYSESIDEEHGFILEDFTALQ